MKEYVKPSASDPILHEITAARIRMLFEKAFFGNLALRLEVVDASPWCKSTATDGRKFYYNRDYIKKLSKDELLFQIAHSVLHCAYDTFGRRGHRDKGLHDMAVDYVINHTLVNENCGKMPEGGLYDKRFTDDMTSEEIYELLKKDSVTVKMTIDDHLELGNDAANGNGDGSGEVEVTVMGDGNGPPKLTEDDLQQIRNEMRANLLAAAQAVGADKVPLGIRRMIADLISPKLDWRALLDSHIRSMIKDDYTFQRMSRANWAMMDEETFTARFLMPAQDYMDTVEIDCAIDASGSMSDEMLRDLISEVKGIALTFKDFTIRLWSFDTQVHNFKKFTLENVDELDYWECGGGGGTIFQCNWDYMIEQGIEPKRFICFTDGLDGGQPFWGTEGYCDTLFIVHSDPGRRLIAPFGITAHYESKE